jgi:hypothetical protein
MTMTETRPEYLYIPTQNARPMAPGTKRLILDAGEQGETAGEILARCQTGDDCVNWLIDTDGTIYEVAGWDRAVLEFPNAYVIRLVAVSSKAQTYSLGWLLGQLSHKREIEF